MYVNLTEGFTAGCGCDCNTCKQPLLPDYSQKASQLAVVVTGRPALFLRPVASQKASQLAVVVTLSILHLPVQFYSQKASQLAVVVTP